MVRRFTGGFPDLALGLRSLVLEGLDLEVCGFYLEVQRQIPNSKFQIPKIKPKTKVSSPKSRV
jgi:hypothetical protein